MSVTGKLKNGQKERVTVYISFKKEERPITPTAIYFDQKEIATKHKLINSSYKFDFLQPISSININKFEFC